MTDKENSNTRVLFWLLSTITVIVMVVTGAWATSINNQVGVNQKQIADLHEAAAVQTYELKMIKAELEDLNQTLKQAVMENGRMRK